MSKQRGGKSRRLGTIDLETGEIFEDGVPVWVKAKIRWKEDWIMGFQEAFLRISEDKDMTHQMTRVWLNLLGRLGFENWVAIPQVEVCESLSMKKSDVSRAIKKLCDKGILLRGPKLGRTTALKINSRYAWKGKVSNLEKDRMGLVKDFFSEKEKHKNRSYD